MIHLIRFMLLIKILLGHLYLQQLNIIFVGTGSRIVFYLYHSLIVIHSEALFIYGSLILGIQQHRFWMSGLGCWDLFNKYSYSHCDKIVTILRSLALMIFHFQNLVVAI